MQIDKHIPIPEPALPGRPIKYPFKLLEVGGSFAINESDLASARSSKVRFSNLTGRTFVIARDDDGKPRAWRTA